MTNQPNLILFATIRPMLIEGFRDVLRLAGFVAEPVMLHPRDAFAALRPNDAWLIFADARDAPDALILAHAVRRAPQSRFILCGSAITPEMLRMGVETSIHGVLSTALPVEEAADVLARIWQGERQYRFGGNRTCYTLPPPSSGADFDADWMFGHAV